MNSVLSHHDSGTWVERLHGLSTLALELWPQEAPHWRVAGGLVLPPPTSAQSQRSLQGLLAYAQALAVHGGSVSSSASSAAPSSAGWSRSAPLASGGSGGDAGGGGLGPSDRAMCLRALSAMEGGQRSARQLAPLMAALVDGGGVSGSKSGLAYQLSLDEIRDCVVAVARGRTSRSEAPLRDFATDAAARLSAARTSLSLADLHEVRSALHSLGVACDEFDSELRGRLRLLAAASLEEETISLGELPKELLVKEGSALDTRAVIASSRVLLEPSACRGPLLRQALLPGVLPAGVAAQLLPYALPVDGTPNSAHEFVVAMATERIASGARLLSTNEIGAAMQGVLSLQARGGDFVIQQAARVLRALWPRVTTSLPHLGPSSLSAALRAYCWQLQFSRQEFALTGITLSHPIVGATDHVPGSSWNRQSPGKDHEAGQDLKTKLLWPAFSRLAEMPLSHVAACFTAIAPPVSPPAMFDDADRLVVRKAVEDAFPRGEGRRRGSVPASLTTEDEAAWCEDYWESEMQALSASELLELVCGLREVAPELHDAKGGGQSWWVLDSLLRELERRLRPAGQDRRAQPSVELSHFLLLRMCRVMDLWQGHEVEEVLKQLLSDPEAIKPLPTPLFAAVLAALRDFAVPKELPLRLVAAFLDRVDRGEREVLPAQWADLLCIVCSLDESPSWARITPRLLQQLVPHLAHLPAQTLAAVLASLAARAPQAEARPALLLESPMERAPEVAAGAVRQAILGSSWDFQQIVSSLGSLGKLGWYSDASVAAALSGLLRTPLVEAHAPQMLPLVRSCVDLRVHHSPLLHKVIVWYAWCNAYLRLKPLPTYQVDELIDLAEHLIQLSFQSLELQGIITENLKNPNATSRQSLALLSALARQSHFPPEFKEACARICSASNDSDLASLTSADLVAAFNIHLCAVFDGPAALKHWLTEDEEMKKFFQVHTSQKWYQAQDRERAAFLQSSAYSTLLAAAELEGLELRPSDPGEVYHIELVSKDARERLNTWSNNPPTAVLCVRSREQLRWYAPIGADATAEVEDAHNRCHQFRFMFRGAVQKVRHLQAMGYRPAVVWMSEWNALTTVEERGKYLRAAIDPVPGQQSAAFSPSPEQDAYA